MVVVHRAKKNQLVTGHHPNYLLSLHLPCCYFLVLYFTCSLYTPAIAYLFSYILMPTIFPPMSHPVLFPFYPYYSFCVLLCSPCTSILLHGNTLTTLFCQDLISSRMLNTSMRSLTPSLQQNWRWKSSSLGLKCHSG